MHALSTRSCGPVLLLGLLQFGLAACSGRTVSRSVGKPVDSTEAVAIAVRALRSAVHPAGSLSVLSFKRDSGVILIGLTEQGPPHVGGGGMVRLSNAGEVLRVELWQ